MTGGPQPCVRHKPSDCEQRGCTSNLDKHIRPNTYARLHPKIQDGASERMRKCKRLLYRPPLPPKGPGQRKDCVARTPPKRPGQRKHCSATAVSITPRRCIREFAQVQNCVARTPPRGPGQTKECVARTPKKRPAQRKSSCSATSVDKVGLQGHVCNRASNVDGRLTG